MVFQSLAQEALERWTQDFRPPLKLQNVVMGGALPPSSEGHTYRGPLRDGYWVDAANLTTGYRLLNDDATWAEVVSVAVEDAPLRAYNLTVADFHTYFVAANRDASPVWVHNGPCDKFNKGLELDNPRLTPKQKIEADTASRLSEVQGEDFRLTKTQRDGDFVSRNGTTYDAVGQPRAYDNWDEAQFLKSLDSHLVKTHDHIVVDLKGASQAQINIIISHISSSPLTKIGQVIYVY